MKKIFILLTILALTGCANDTIIEIEGRVSMKGSSPHNYLSIKDSQNLKSYKIQNQSQFDLMRKQNQTVKIKAVLIKEAVGPGFPAVIEVIEVK